MCGAARHPTGIAPSLRVPYVVAPAVRQGLGVGELRGVFMANENSNAQGAKDDVERYELLEGHNSSIRCTIVRLYRCSAQATDFAMHQSGSVSRWFVPREWLEGRTVSLQLRKPNMTRTKPPSMTLDSSTTNWISSTGNRSCQSRCRTLTSSPAMNLPGLMDASGFAIGLVGWCGAGASAAKTGAGAAYIRLNLA